MTVSHLKYWFFLFCAIALEVAGTSVMKISQNGTGWLGPGAGLVLMFALIALSYYCLSLAAMGLPIGVASLVMVGLAFYALSLAVRDMDLAVAYALWGGFGILGTSLGGSLFLGQRLKPCAWLGMALLIGGMTVLKFS